MTSETPPPPHRKRLRRHWPFWLALGGGVSLLALAVAVEGVYLARRTLARDAAIGWLRDRGVEADIEVESLELDGFVGRVRIGPANAPEVTVERAEVHYRTLGPWNGQPLGVEVGEVRLVKPVAQASWKAGKFSMGSLDRMLDEFRQAPPRPDTRQPKIAVEGARFILTTDYGLADLRGDARLEDGKLLALNAELKPTVMRIGEFKTALNNARVTATTHGDRVAIAARLGADSLSLGSTSVAGLAVSLNGELPYPDLKARRGDGKVVLTARATADTLASGEASAQAVAAEVGFDGLAKGWIDSLTVAGASRLSLKAGVARTGDLSLTGVTATGAGPAGFDANQGASLRLASAVQAHGAWPIMGPVLKADDPTLVAVKRLLGGFDLTAPGVDLAVGRTLAVSLNRPARIAGPSGTAVVSAQAGGLLFDGAGGALHLVLSGGDLPTVDAAVPRYSLTPTGVTATTTLALKASLGPLRDADLKTSGKLTLNGAAISYVTTSCVPVSLSKLELGVNDVETPAGRLCPTAAPLLTLNDGAWRLRARAEGVSAVAPFLEARVTDGAGTVDIGGKGETLQADMAIAGAQVIDTAAETRFNPLRLAGSAVSRGGDWTGDFAIADPAGRKLADAHLIQAASGKGGVTIETGTLTLAEGGLQPAGLSPFAALVASPAVGRVRFTGQVGWEGEATTSSGVAVLEDVGFRTPVGAISGVAGRLVFTSLTPVIITAPGQTLTATRVAAFLPLTDATATFELTPTALKLSGAQVTAAQGRLTLDPLSIPLPPTSPPGAPKPPPAPLPPWEGRLHVDGVQLADFVKASPFADRADVDAKVTGLVPFVVTPAGLRIIEGKLAATQPGRISLRREALSVVSAEGGATTTTAPDAAVPLPVQAPTAPPPDTIADLAYQAMENLAFDQLDVALNSLPAGRLGALFHIRGRHDPPKRQELRIGLVDLLTRKFLQKSLPLPSGTPINLTLDTTLNLDEVLRDVIAAAPAGSAPVQP